MNERQLFRIVLAVGLIVFILVPGGLWILYRARSLLYPVVTALLVAYVLYPIVHGISKMGVPRWLTVLGMIVVMFGLTTVLVYKVAPTIYMEVKVIGKPREAVQTMSRSRLIHIARRISQQLAEYGVIQEQWTEETIKNAISAWVKSQRSFLFGEAGGLAIKGGQFLMIFFFILVFGLLHGNRVHKTLVRLLPNYFFEPGTFILNQTTSMFGYYLRGVVVETLILGCICLLLMIPVCLLTGLSLVLAPVIALVIAVTNVVRIIGPIFGGLIGVIIVLTSTTDLEATVGVVLVTIIVQLLDNMLVMPLVMKEQVQIHPVLCLLGVLTGGILGGILGMILAIPVIGGIKVVYEVLSVEMKRFHAGPEAYRVYAEE